MPLPRPLADALWAVQFRLNNRFRRRLTVLKCEATGAAASAAAGVTVVGYGPGEALPDELAAALSDRFGADFPAVQRAEAAEGATLWVGSLDGEPRGFARTRPGDRAPGWHEALGPDDRLVYAMATQRAARGRGVSTAVLRAALAAVPPGGAAWADTMVWNAPALTVLRRVGFVDLYEADPLPDHPD
ncbi:GNAT family N-acetyltransferase [Alienimonas sp. DA493]|uniref:GNAT family N-acetyltransferase n=1 Tax=Alienimonas sp. DA493 TaxID=3373605 RepID=UPI003754FC0F